MEKVPNTYLVLRESLLFGASSIVAPLVFFGAAGWLLDDVLETGRIFLFSSLAVSFVATHILLFRKLKKIQHEQRKEQKEQQEQEEKQEEQYHI